LIRIAEIVDIPFVREHYKEISRAASRMRGLHRGLSNKLNRWLEGQSEGAFRGNDDDMIDDELGLTFGDIRNSLLLVNVRSIVTLTEPYLRENLGRAERLREDA
jgi:hypothetical protein